jgi:hypothetical protein
MEVRMLMKGSGVDLGCGTDGWILGHPGGPTLIKLSIGPDHTFAWFLRQDADDQHSRRF